MDLLVQHFNDLIKLVHSQIMLNNVLQHDVSMMSSHQAGGMCSGRRTSPGTRSAVLQRRAARPHFREIGSDQTPEDACMHACNQTRAEYVVLESYRVLMKHLEARVGGQKVLQIAQHTVVLGPLLRTLLLTTLSAKRATPHDEHKMK